MFRKKIGLTVPFLLDFLLFFKIIFFRISKSAWLKGWEHEVIERVNQRLDMMTNLEMETAEELQIANYGIGRD